MEFRKLSLAHQLNLLMSKGRLVASIIYENRKINLYEMDAKYFGAWHNAAGHFVEKIEELKDRSLFQNYLQDSSDSF